MRCGGNLNLVGTSYLVPPDRNFPWIPGMMSKGGASGAGIPKRSLISAVLSPLGGGADDTAQINSAIAACPAGQVVFLNAGNFLITNPVFILNGSITLRGNGAGSTFLIKTNGSPPRTGVQANGSTLLLPQGGNVYNQAAAVTAASPAVCSITAHELTVDSVFRFTSGTLPGGISLNTDYYVISAGFIAQQQFQFSTTKGGSAVNTTGSTQGNITVALSIQITSASPAVVSWKAHGWLAGSQIIFNAGTLPTGLSLNTVYYVIASGLTADTFQVSGTYGGAAINTTGGDQTGIVGLFAGIDGKPNIIVGPSAFPQPDNTTSQNLTVDGQQGSFSITVGNAASPWAYTAGQFVLVDELMNGYWQQTPIDFQNNGNAYNGHNRVQVWGNDRCFMNMHYPQQQFQDDCSTTSRFYGPFDADAQVFASISGSTLTVTGGAGLAVNHTIFDLSGNVLGLVTADLGGGQFTLSNPVASSAQVMWGAQVAQFNGSVSGATLTVNSVTYGAIKSSTFPYWVVLDLNNRCIANVVGGSGASWTLDNVSRIAVNENLMLVRVPQYYYNYCRIGRFIGEMKEIASVNGNTITFTSPLSITYRAANQAQVTAFTNNDSNHPSVHVTNSGVENMTLVGGGDGGIRFLCAAYCWAKNIEVTQWQNVGAEFGFSFRIEYRDNYNHTVSFPTPGGQGYSIGFGGCSSEVLIENCISRDVNKVMVSRCSGAGSVCAYNYMDDGWISYDATWHEIGLNCSHLAGGHHMLFEGNYCFNADSDFTHGSSIYMTHLRNWLSGVKKSFDAPTQRNIRCAGPASYGWWHTFVGNVMGVKGGMSGWLYDDLTMGCDSSGGNCVGGVAASWGSQGVGFGVVWMVGVDQERFTSQAELNVLSNVIRDGNYDFLTNSQRWHNNPTKPAIPSSLYLGGRPAFFGANPWPWINPQDGTINTLPAKKRYDDGTPNTVP